MPKRFSVALSVMVLVYLLVGCGGGDSHSSRYNYPASDGTTTMATPTPVGGVSPTPTSTPTPTPTPSPSGSATPTPTPGSSPSPSPSPTPLFHLGSAKVSLPLQQHKVANVQGASSVPDGVGKYRFIMRHPGIIILPDGTTTTLANPVEYDVTMDKAATVVFANVPQDPLADVELQLLYTASGGDPVAIGQAMGPVSAFPLETEPDGTTQIVMANVAWHGVLTPGYTNLAPIVLTDTGVAQTITIGKIGFASQAIIDGTIIIAVNDVPSAPTLAITIPTGLNPGDHSLVLVNGVDSTPPKILTIQ